MMASLEVLPKLIYRPILNINAPARLDAFHVAHDEYKLPHLDILVGCGLYARGLPPEAARAALLM